jgi:hypothetical protein
MTFFNPPIQQDATDVTLPPWATTLSEGKFRPTKDRILGRRIDVPYEGKIVIPDSAKKPSPTEVKVKIIAIGPKVDAEEVKIGKMAMIGPYRDLEIGNFLLFQQADIRVML